MGAGQLAALADHHHLAQALELRRAPAGRRQPGDQLGQRLPVVARAERVDRDQHLGARVGEHVAQVPGLGEGVEGGDAGAEPVRGERRAEPLPAVGAEQAEGAAAPQPELGERRRERLDPPAERGEAELLAGVDDRDRLAVRVRQLAEQIGEVAAVRPGRQAAGS